MFVRKRVRKKVFSSSGKWLIMVSLVFWTFDLRKTLILNVNIDIYTV